MYCSFLTKKIMKTTRRSMSRLLVSDWLSKTFLKITHKNPIFIPNSSFVATVRLFIEFNIRPWIGLFLLHLTSSRGELTWPKVLVYDWAEQQIFFRWTRDIPWQTETWQESLDMTIDLNLKSDLVFELLVVKKKKWLVQLNCSYSQIIALLPPPKLLSFGLQRPTPFLKLKKSLKKKPCHSRWSWFLSHFSVSIAYCPEPKNIIPNILPYQVSPDDKTPNSILLPFSPLEQFLEE